MRKFSASIVKVLALVISGLTVVVAVAVGYHVLSLMFSAIFGALAYVLGPVVAGFALFVCNYLLVVGVVVFLWMNILRPGMIVYKISSFIQLLVLKPKLFFSYMYQLGKGYVKLAGLYVQDKWSQFKSWLRKDKSVEAVILETV